MSPTVYHEPALLITGPRDSGLGGSYSGAWPDSVCIYIGMQYIVYMYYTYTVSKSLREMLHLIIIILIK